jgi:N-acyl-D-amino-acid deacylase
MNDSRRKINAVLAGKAASAILLACAASLVTVPAPSAINGVSAPRLLLTCLDFHQNADKSVVVTCTVTNTSSTSGGQAPVIQKLSLLVGASIYPMSPLNVSNGEKSYSGSLTFPPGTYQKGIIFAVEGVAADGIFGDTLGFSPNAQFVASNSVTVIDPTQPPQLYLPGNCTYEATLSSTPLNFPPQGGSAFLVVDTETQALGYPKGCPWTAGTHNGAADVIMFAAHGATQVGPGEAAFTVLPNSVVNGNSNSRPIVMPETAATPNAVDVIAATAGVPGYHGSFQFTQDGLTCAYRANGFTALQSGSSAANPGVVTITTVGQSVLSDGSKGLANSNCRWSVTSASPAVTIVGGLNAIHTGTGTFQYYVSANNSPTARPLQFSLGTALVVSTSQPGTQGNVNITLTTSPAGLSVVADNTTYTAPHTFQWAAGTQHTIGTASPQASGGTQYVFASWSQGGTENQTITASGDATYTANFTHGGAVTNVVLPDGTAGFEIQIGWTYSGPDGATGKIDLLRAGAVVTNIDPAAPLNSLKKSWVIPVNTTAGNNYQVRIAPNDTSIKGDESRATVRIDPWHKPFDDLVTTFRTVNQIPGSQLGIVHEGKLIWVNGDGQAVKPSATSPQVDVTANSLFRIASITKPITAAAIIRLQETKLAGLLDNKVFDPANGVLKDFARYCRDARLFNITVRQLLLHRGGWDRANALSFPNVGVQVPQNFDPTFQWRFISNNLRDNGAPDLNKIVQFVLGNVKLNNDPGTKNYYSNFGYALLGLVIEKVSGQSYPAYVTEMLKGISVNHTSLANTLLRDALPDEVQYYDYPGAPLVWDVFPPHKDASVPEPYGGFDMSVVAAHGGLVSKVSDLLRFLVSMNKTNTAISQLIGVPLENVNQYAGYFGVNYFAPAVTDQWLPIPPQSTTVPADDWAWSHTGSLPGTLGLLAMQDFVGPPANHVGFAVLFNSRPNVDADPLLTALQNSLFNLAQQVRDWPEADLFPQF